MAYWLMKEEPTHYGFEELVKDKVTSWDGIRNATALIHLRKVKKGDQAFFYHTGKVKAVVGTARFVSDAYQDLSAGDPKMAAAEVKPLKLLPRPVTLKEMRVNKKLNGLDLLRISRLSFMPVSPEHWEEILRMAGEAG
jgi:predicted RNA-binding protein with PUA-like domain